MTKFSDLKQDTPRVVVMFKGEDDKELFQWGMIGKMPILTLIGCIVRVQEELSASFLQPEACPESSLVIAWDDEKREFSWFVHPSIPIDSLVGMLETIKMTILATLAAQQASNQQMILGPDGRPVRR